MEQQHRSILKDMNRQRNMNILHNKNVSDIKTENSRCNETIQSEDGFDSSSSEDYRSAEEDDVEFITELDSMINGFSNVHILTPKGKKLKAQLHKSFNLTRVIDPHLSKQLAQECEIAKKLWSDRNNTKREVSCVDEDYDDTYLSVLSETSNQLNMNTTVTMDDNGTKISNEKYNSNETWNESFSGDINKENQQPVNTTVDLENNLQSPHYIDKQKAHISANNIKFNNETHLKQDTVCNKTIDLCASSANLSSVSTEKVSLEYSENSINSSLNVSEAPKIGKPAAINNSFTKSEENNLTAPDILLSVINKSPELFLKSELPILVENSQMSNVDVTFNKTFDKNSEDPAQRNFMDNDNECNIKQLHCLNNISDNSSLPDSNLLLSPETNISNSEGPVTNDTIHDFCEGSALNIILNERNDKDILENIEDSVFLISESAQQETHMLKQQSEKNLLNSNNEKKSVEYNMSNEDGVQYQCASNINKPLVNMDFGNCVNDTFIKQNENSSASTINMNLNITQDIEDDVNKEMFNKGIESPINKDIVSHDDESTVVLDDFIETKNSDNSECSKNLNDTITVYNDVSQIEHVNLNETITLNEEKLSDCGTFKESDLNSTQGLNTNPVDTHNNETVVLNDVEVSNVNQTINVNDIVEPSMPKDLEQATIRNILDTTPENYEEVKFNISKNTLNLFDDLHTKNQSLIGCDDSFLNQLMSGKNVQKQQILPTIIKEESFDGLLVKIDESYEILDDKNKQSEISSPGVFCRNDLLESTMISNLHEKTFSKDNEKSPKSTSNTSIFKWIGQFLSPSKSTVDNDEAPDSGNVSSLLNIEDNTVHVKSPISDFKMDNDFACLSDETPTVEFMSVSTTSEPFNESRGGNENNEYLAELEHLRELAKQNECKINEIKDQIENEQKTVLELENITLKLEKELAVKNDNETTLNTTLASFEKRVEEMKLENEKLVIDNKSKLQRLREDCDVSQNHLLTVENAFSNLHKKYEQCKKSIETLKLNQNILETSNGQLRDITTEQELNLALIEEHATKQIEFAKSDYENTEHQHKVEMIRYTALIKKAELQKSSLEEAVTKKKEENAELLALCDSLIQKVG